LQQFFQETSMTHRIRALVLLPVLFSVLIIPPFLNNQQPDLSQIESISAVPLLEEIATTVGIEDPVGEQSVGRFPVQDLPKDEIDDDQGVILDRLEPDLAISEASVQETPAAVEQQFSKEDITLQLEVFTELWSVVNEKYLYPDFNGLDWLETRRQVREKIEIGLSFEDFYREMERVVRSLGDEHSFYLTPEKVAAQEAKFAGNIKFAGIGVISKPAPDKGCSVILLTFPGGPAELAGLQPRDCILAVDGIPILDEIGAARDLLRGPEGTGITLTVRSPGEEERFVNVQRGSISGPIPIPTSILRSNEGKRIGYMLLVSFADSTIEERIGEALASMSVDRPLDGLIIDNRFNEGGADRVLSGALSYFTDGLLGHFISRRAESPFEVTAVDVAGSQQMPLVVIVGPKTVSYGEVFSGILQDSGRAFLLGEPTMGNVETLSGHNLSDGSRAWIAYKAFRPANNPGQDWEQQGVIPDWTVPLVWADYTLEKDPAVVAALQYIDIGEIFLSIPDGLIVQFTQSE
jgi:carboxyl-terminal processing protease